MPDTPDPIAVPDWLTEGAQVASVTPGHSRWPEVTRVTILRIYKRYVTTVGGDRYSLPSLERRVGGAWGNTYTLRPLDDPKTQEGLSAGSRDKTSRRVTDLMKLWRETGEDEHAREAHRRLTAHLETP